MLNLDSKDIDGILTSTREILDGLSRAAILSLPTRRLREPARMLIQNAAAERLLLESCVDRSVSTERIEDFLLLEYSTRAVPELDQVLCMKEHERPRLLWKILQAREQLPLSEEHYSECRSSLKKTYRQLVDLTKRHQFCVMCDGVKLGEGSGAVPLDELPLLMTELVWALTADSEVTVQEVLPNDDTAVIFAASARGALAAVEKAASHIRTEFNERVAFRFALSYGRTIWMGKSPSGLPVVQASRILGAAGPWEVLVTADCPERQVQGAFEFLPPEWKDRAGGPRLIPVKSSDDGSPADIPCFSVHV